MAGNNDSPLSFGIEETMDMGVGNTELIKDLMADESISGNSDDLQPVDDEEKGKKDVKTEKTDDAPTEEKTDGQDLISNFLEENPDDEDPDDEPIKEEKKVEKKTEGEPEEPKAEETSQFTALANDLYKLGIFTKDEEGDEGQITSAEEFLEKFELEKKKGATEAIHNFIGQFGEDYQNAFDAIYVKGANPKEYFATYDAVVNYAQMDMAKEQNQEKVVRQALTDQGLESEDVESEVERLKNYGDLEQVAAKHHKVLVRKEALKLQQMEQEAEAALKQKSAVKAQYINNVQNVLQEKVKAKEFDGIPINPKLAAELQDFLLVDKWKTSSGETLTDFDRAILELKRPENHMNKVKLGLLLKIMEKDPTLSTIQRSGITKKTDQIFSETAKQVTKSKANVASGSTKPYSWFQQ